ncbi:tol-pal system protein YbgF [Legionella clemsonensis]|uniref:Cell division coordinator CpoB n=1 Tax=Legionella clemsonensis TaxID=1867846 RepID=A0A222NZY4_9GAMM|nr:tol-pal system protein YbgF [Legionella clemsonensis]ASQ45136.1 tol-pal system protein YbgF [Legionella clemsonensis]
MIKSHRLLLCLCFSWIFSFQVFAEAPVVDDSENFAILDDDQQAAIEQPVAKAQLNDMDDEEEIALAQDNSDSNNANAGLLDKLHGLQQELQELRGQLEIQAHDLKLLQQQQLAFYKDLDARLRNTNPGKSAQAAPAIPDNKPTELSLKPADIQTPPPAETQARSKIQAENIVTAPLNSTSRGNPADEQISYMAAYDLVKSKRFDDALTAMQRFVVQYPQGGYTANAQYWLGELYLVKSNYAKAIEHFEIVLKKFPSSSKAAASTLKIGYALAASGKIEDARMRLQEVLRNYPDTPTAQLAATKLETLGVS